MAHTGQHLSSGGDVIVRYQNMPPGGPWRLVTVVKERALRRGGVFPLVEYTDIHTHFLLLGGWDKPERTQAGSWAQHQEDGGGEVGVGFISV